MISLAEHRKAVAIEAKERLSRPIPKGMFRVVVEDKHGMNPPRLFLFDQPVALDGPEVRKCRGEAAFAWFATFNETAAREG